MAVELKLSSLKVKKKKKNEQQNRIKTFDNESLLVLPLLVLG